MMVIPTYWCNLENEADVAMKVQEMMASNPGATSFRVEDNSAEVQQEALADLDLFCEYVDVPPA